MNAGSKISPLWFFSASSTLLAPPKSAWYLRKDCMYSCSSGIIFEKPASTLIRVAVNANSSVSRMKKISSGRRKWKIQ
ncbi:hypothetical protein D9M68_347940 [compost metagenome]